MSFWIYFWGITLVLVLIAYAGLAVWVTLGGMSDIRSMLATLKKQHQGMNDDSH